MDEEVALKKAIFSMVGSWLIAFIALVVIIFMALDGEDNPSWFYTFHWIWFTIGIIVGSISYWILKEIEKDYYRENE